MNRYKQTFSKLKQSHQKAFVPFVNLGDPTAELSLKIIDVLIAAGADALELGLPFSDPLADGPTIQRAHIRALKNKTYTNIALELIHLIRKKYPLLPIGILAYTNLAYGYGKEKFFRKLASVGVDSLLLADLPLEMIDILRPYFLQNKISQVLIAPPNADNKTLEQISKFSQDYIYLMSRSGVTGSEIKTTEDTKSIISQLRQYNCPPILQGFGISTKEHAQAAIANGADGIFVGSALVKIIEDNLENELILLEKINLKARSIKAGCTPAT